MNRFFIDKTIKEDEEIKIDLYKFFFDPVITF